MYSDCIDHGFTRRNVRQFINLQCNICAKEKTFGGGKMTCSLSSFTAPISEIMGPAPFFGEIQRAEGAQLPNANCAAETIIRPSGSTPAAPDTMENRQTLNTRDNRAVVKFFNKTQSTPVVKATSMPEYQLAWRLHRC
jgi:hypothetical protein